MAGCIYTSWRFHRKDWVCGIGKSLVQRSTSEGTRGKDLCGIGED